MATHEQMVRSWHFGELIGMFEAQRGRHGSHIQVDGDQLARYVGFNLENFNRQPVFWMEQFYHHANTPGRPWEYAPLFEYLVEQIKAAGEWTNTPLGPGWPFPIPGISRMVEDQMDGKDISRHIINNREWSLLTPALLEEFDPKQDDRHGKGN
jgi:hypothetical protein